MLSCVNMTERHKSRALAAAGGIYLLLVAAGRDG